MTDQQPQSSDASSGAQDERNRPQAPGIAPQQASRYLPPGVVPPPAAQPPYAAPQPPYAPARSPHAGAQPPATPAYPQPAPVYAPYSADRPQYGRTPTTPAYPQYAVAQPQYAPYGSPVQPPYPGYRLPSGRKFWALGFLYFIPYLGWLVAPIVALTLNAGARRDPSPLVRENARWAANWSLTVLIAGVVAFITILGSAMAGAATDEAGGNGDVWFPVAMVGLLFLGIVWLAQLVICIIGTVQADRRVFDPVVVFSFFRRVD
ncbi:DUF4870 domain-containing protein [Leucobacter ruminantium]|uniref:DUF4870 domain-containing protein n=1 Tax=Leucobacter ruminantium TaxID=1289170 RepID=A0A939RYU1_9MICO|nr:DUF4870 domain-containing protein [Leucobacter ruminantium]